MAVFDGSTGPKVGIFVDATDRSMPLLQVAEAAEERGFTGLFLNEHTHLPVDSSRSSFPTGGEIPDRYARFWCPFVALAMVAARTRLEVGPTVSLIAEHDPIALAKSIATLDVLSEGRFTLGVGYGWHREEFEAQGFPARDRVAVFEDKLMIMKALWTSEVASYEGRFLSLQPSTSWPKPLTRPHPPIIAGVPANERNYKRMARWADGWIPMSTTVDKNGKPREAPGLGEAIRSIHAELENVGRDPATFRLISRAYDHSREGLELAIGSAVEHGVERVNIHIDELGTDETLAVLDATSEIVRRILS